eukprot:6180495-Pleurochrysis_carterae.AAC.2
METSTLRHSIAVFLRDSRKGARGVLRWGGQHPARLADGPRSGDILGLVSRSAGELCSHQTSERVECLPSSPDICNLFLAFLLAKLLLRRMFKEFFRFALPFPDSFN